MTKTSMCVMLVPTIYVYFKVLSEYNNNDKPIKKILLELLIFIIISLPLAMWFQIYNLSNGNNTLGIINPKDDFYIGNESLWTRFGLVNPFTSNEANMLNRILYSSLCFETNEDNLFVKIMIVIAILILSNFIYYFIKNFKKNKLITITILSYFLFYIYLNIQMPYSCSLNARYLVVPLSLGFISIAYGIQNEKKNWLKIENYISIITMSLLSIFYFLFIV